MSTTDTTPSTNDITIPLPTSLTSTSSTLPSSTSQALIAHLRNQGAIPELSTLLADSLARSGWTDRVRALSAELLRNGSCDTFPELMTEVLRRARISKSQAAGDKQIETSGTGKDKDKGSDKKGANGISTPTGVAINGVNGNGAIPVSKEWSGGPDGLPDVRIPETTVEVAVEFLKDRIKDVVQPIDDDSD
ncbi:hypothetical protein LTR84_010628 [Exophiala bonariae]|uniref:Uncharacterized protein n=1 Tax=Exophiala bonariae TaxID=1690606 RepID=A0AAV9MSM9_9EURO|nr:hypothetical protein LTR84_010628 [Exophiala bonariae]